MKRRVERKCNAMERDKLNCANVAFSQEDDREEDGDTPTKQMIVLFVECRVEVLLTDCRLSIVSRLNN